MPETLSVEVRRTEERRLAEAVLRGRGYDVVVTLRRRDRLQVRGRQTTGRSPRRWRRVQRSRTPDRCALTSETGGRQPYADLLP
jgi:hypothetical protein